MENVKEKVISRVISKQLGEIWAAIEANRKAIKVSEDNSSEALSVSDSAKGVVTEGYQALSSDIKTNRSALDSLSKTLSDLRSEVSGIITQNTNIQKELNEISKVTYDNREGLGSLARFYASLESRMSSLESRLNGLSADMNGIASELGSVKGKINGWSDKGIDTVLSSFSHIKSTIDHLVGDIGYRRDYDSAYNSKDVLDMTEVKSGKIGEKAGIPGSITGPSYQPVSGATKVVTASQIGGSSAVKYNTSEGG